jgi:hypothetical protein
MRGAVTLIVRGHFYPSLDRPFHVNGPVGGPCCDFVKIS